jgi:hypothetical protein
MAPQTLPGRVASPSPPIPARSPRLWPNLPAEAQMQIAQIIAELMRRMQAIHGTPGREIARADRPKRR